MCQFLLLQFQCAQDQEPLCEPNFLCIFVLRNISWPRVNFVDSSNIFTPPLPPTVVNATARSMAVVPGSYSVLLCGLYYRALHILKSSRALCLHVSSLLLALLSPRLGKRELVCVLLVHLLFVLYVLVFLSFFSSSWCRGLAAVCDCGTPWTFLLHLLLAALCLCVSSVLLAFWSPCSGKRELVFVLIVHLFVSYAHIGLCRFFSSSWYQGLAATSACGSFCLPFCKQILIPQNEPFYFSTKLFGHTQVLEM